MSECPNATNGCPSGQRPSPTRTSGYAGMNKTLGWFSAVMLGCTLVLLAIMIKNVGAPARTGEDATEVGLAAAQAPMAQPLPEHVIQFPAGLGNGQIQLIDTLLPTGIGNQPMQLINTPLPTGIGNQQMQLTHHLGPQFSAGLGNGQIQLIKQSGAYLGLSLSAVTPELAKQLVLPAGMGAYVNIVVPNSPGGKAGVQVGDVLLRLDRTDVAGADAVGKILAGKNAGAVLKATIQRGPVKQSMHITLENAPLGLDVGQVQNTVWMGLDVQDIDAIMRIQFNLPDAQGVLISYVAPGSPAAAAGLGTGDMLRRVGEVRIRDVRQFASIIQKSQPGQTLRISAMRAGAPLDVNVTLGRKPTTPAAIPFLAPADIVIEGAWIGMDVGELAKTDVQALGLPPGTRGVLVNDVEGPPATSVGFQAGDVILSVNNAATPDIKSFVNATRKQSGAVVEVLRGGKHLFLTVPPPGYTQQGSPLNLGIDKKFRQIAATQPAVIALLVSDKDIRATVASEANTQAVVFVDLAGRNYAIVELKNGRQALPDLLQQNNAAAVLAGDISGPTAAALAQRGVAVYAGVVGNVLDSVAMYQQQGLAPAGGR